MAKCGCSSSCTCLVASSDSLIISGDGNDSGYRGTLRIDPTSPLPITISAAGVSISGSGVATGYANNVESVPYGSVSAINVQDALNELEDNKQPKTPTLTTLSTYDINGIVTQTATDTFTGRTITGTANKVTVTNGNGVLGNPTITLPSKLGISDILDDNGNEALSITQGISSAVNRILLTNSPTGVSPILSTTGSNADINLVFSAKGVGVIKFQKAMVTDIVILVDGATINTDASLGNHFRVTLSGNRLLANPTNPTDGEKIIWEIKQDAVGSRSITLGAKFSYGTDLTYITLSSTPDKIDYIGATYNASSDKWHITAFIRGY